MIQYALKCEEGHQFESWFQSAAAFEDLKSSGHLACAFCGNKKVEKAIMAPSLASGQKTVTPQPLSHPTSEPEKAIKDMRAHVEANADYVGNGFAEEARSMYLGDAPERAIYGEASGADAKALIDEGVPVAPLPFVPNRKAN
ncbi:MAG: DUF1178 family protein [Roseobacter sp.]